MIIIVSCSNDECTETLPQKIPCRISVSLSESTDSRMDLYEENEGGYLERIKSVWEEGDRFTIRNLNDNKVYTFILEEGAGKSNAIFYCEDTPIDGDQDYEVFYPHTIIDNNGFNNYFNLKNPICSYNDKIGYLEKAFSMRHIVGDYREIIFDNYSYGRKMLSNGKEKFPATEGKNFYKSSFLKINVRNLPEDIIPISMEIKILNSISPIFYETNNYNKNDGTEFENSVTLKDYPRNNAFEIYLPLSYNEIIFSKGSTIQVTLASSEGYLYTTTKTIEKEWSSRGGGKYIIIYMDGEKWEKTENKNPNGGTTPEWEEIIK